MRIVGPQSFTVGTATAVADPAQSSSGNPSAAVQVQNSSPYQLDIGAGGGALSLQPFTAQTVEISTQPITITPLAGATGACSITLVFLLATAAGNGVQVAGDQGGGGIWVEAPPMSDGPLTAAAIAAAISGFVESGDAVDLLQTGSYVLVAGGAGALPTATFFVNNLQRSYSALLLAFVPGVNGELFCANAQVVGDEANWSTGFMCQPGAIPMQGLMGFGNVVGDDVGITVYGFTATAAGVYQLFGLTSNPTPIRADARTYPVGAIGVDNVSTTATTVTLAGALTNARYLVKTITQHLIGSAGALSSVLGTLNGMGIEISAVTAGGVVRSDALEGILLDANTALQLQIVGTVTAQRTSVIYDVVPA